MENDSSCPCLPKKLCAHIVDACCLVIILMFQGTILNYYMISHYKDQYTSYFFFIADFICIISFVGTLVASYSYLKKTHAHDVEDGFTFSKPQRLKLPPASWLGVLPLSYTSWLFYTIILVTKICVIFKSGLILKLSHQDHFGPQLLQVTVAASSFVFLLLVEGHNWAKNGTPRFAYVTTTCAKTGIEIFDSIAFLSLLLGHIQDMSDLFKDVILILAAVNFFLPAFALYQLSLTDFAMVKMSKPLTLLQHMVHLCLLDIPYLVVRLYLWLSYRERASMFLMKNLLSIVLTLRGMHAELIDYRHEYYSRRSKRNEKKEKFEEVALNEPNLRSAKA